MTRALGTVLVVDDDASIRRGLTAELSAAGYETLEAADGDEGARVAIGDIDASLSERTAEELGSGTIGLPLDVTDSASFSEFLDQVESRLGPLDVLINNAGIMPVGPFVDETDATAARMIDINLHGVIFGSKLALARFLTRGRGHLVNIASSAGKAGIPGGATYCATKYGVVGLSEAIRAEVRRTGIDVSVVMPVGVNTELYSGLPPARGIKTAEPEDVAHGVEQSGHPVEAVEQGHELPREDVQHVDGAQGDDGEVDAAQVTQRDRSNDERQRHRAQHRDDHRDREGQ